MRHIALLICLFLFLLVGCEQTPPAQQTEQPAPIVTAKPATATVPATGVGLFHQPITVPLLELPSEALTYWRSASNEKPALVLFSFDPLLKPIDPSLQAQARTLALTGSPEQLRLHGSFNTADPIILPVQALSAAIDAGLFSKIYWVFPSKVAPEQLTLEQFREQMQEKNILTAEEVAAIKINTGVYTGQLRGIPFEALHYQMLHEISEPIMLHVDMGFFRGLYDNEIKTPLYTLLRDTADSLRGLNWQPLATTLSASTLEGAVSLEVRFLIKNLAELLENPTLLDADMPQTWKLRSEALYAGDMYSETKQIELSQQIVELAPESAAAHYDRFQALFMNKQIEPALQELAQAIRLDPGYGASYIQLAQMAAEDGNTGKALELLGEAEKLFPENSFISLQMAHLLAFDQQYAEASAQLDRLPQQWSTLYHDTIPGVIAELRQQIAAATAPAKSE